MKSQDKLYGPIHKGLVRIAYASNEGSNEEKCVGNDYSKI